MWLQRRLDDLEARRTGANAGTRELKIPHELIEETQVALTWAFSDGGDVTHIIASLKTISEDGSFEIRNLMRGNDTLPTPKLRAVIDSDLFHRAPGRIPAGDVIEFS